MLNGRIDVIGSLGIKPMSQGALVYAATATALAILPKSSSTNYYLKNSGTNNNPAWAPITEADISTSDNTTLNVSHDKHGLCPKLPDDPTMFLNGQGVFSTVSSGAAAGYIAQPYSSVTSKNVVHGFNGYPCVHVLNGSGLVVAPASVTHNTLNDFTVAFSEPSSGTIVATLGSPGIANFATYSSDQTLTLANHYVVVTAEATITLPPAATCASKEYCIKRNCVTGDVTIKADGTEKIDSTNTKVLVANFSSIRVVSDGTGWLIV